MVAETPAASPVAPVAPVTPVASAAPPAFPALFVSHGAPSLLLEPPDHPALAFLAACGRQLDTLPARPQAVVVVSAHWETAVPTVGAALHPETIHDFYGFPDELYRMTYPARGSQTAASAVAAALRAAGLPVQVDSRRGLDHGAWVPLSLLFPRAEVPVVPLSVQAGRDPAHHYAVGQALAGLRRQGYMIVASGSMTHNLRELGWGGGPLQAWAGEFAGWMAEKTLAGDIDSLLNYRRLAPHAVRSHPRDEHLLPFFVALGAGVPAGAGRGKGNPERTGAPEETKAAGQWLHDSTDFRSLRMDAFAFPAHSFPDGTFALTGQGAAARLAPGGLPLAAAAG